MAPSPFLQPDVLVLAGGGVLGEAWMSGVLAGIEDAAGVDFRTTESFVGTSAGSIVSAHLVAGRSPRRPQQRSQPNPTDPNGTPPAGAGPLRSAMRGAARWGWAATAPLAPAALALGAPAGALARAALLAGTPHARRSLAHLRQQVDRSGARFDGRLRVCCVDRRTGRRVVFGAPGAPRATVGQAVQASCSIPWVFAPVTINGREYVDGGAWSATNIDAAPARQDTYVLCLDPTASISPSLSSALGIVRTALRGAATVEILALRRRGAHVRHVGPDPEIAQVMGRNLMDPRPSERVLAGGYGRGLELAAAALRE
jgi:NTE family protein